MIRCFGTRIAVLLFVMVAFFSATAHAYTGTTFRLRIEDPLTGMGRVLTDLTGGQTEGFANSNGDKNNTTAGTIYYSGALDSGLTFQVLATSTTINADGTGGGVLTFSVHVNYSQSSNAQILITLEDSGYNPTPTTPFVAVVNGYNYSGGTNNQGTVTSGGPDLTGGASSVSLQSWINTANADPNFGTTDTGLTSFKPPQTNFPTTLTIPAGSTAAFTDGSGNPLAYSATSTQTSPYSTAPGVGVTFGAGGYSIFSQASISFNSSGAADFTLTASNPVNTVPEPTPLVLLGSALVGVGVLLRKKIIVW